MNTTFLQVILAANMFVIGALCALGVQFAYTHFGPKKHQPEKPHADADNHLPPATKEHLLHQAEAKYQAAIEHSVASFQHKLETTSEQVNTLVKQLATEIIGNELERYRSGLAELRTQAETDMGVVKTEIDAHKSELKTKLDQEIETQRQHIAEQLNVEKQQLVKQIDTKLGDAVASFLLETLKHNVDLGSQTAYLTAVLEEHKADFIKEVADEPKTT